jgi:hypothetical protein
MTKKPTRPTLDERIAADPELQEIFSEYSTEAMLERLRMRHRERKEREAAEARRRARLRRWTFGLLGR